MLVTNLEDMEKIVGSQKDLSWDGWDVVKYKNNPGAQFNKSGAYINGKWYSKSTFQLTEKGWSIPNSLGGKDV